MRKGVAAWLGALAVAGTVTAGAAVIYASSTNAEEQELQSCTDALGLQTPPLSLLDRAWGLAASKGAENKMRDGKISAIVDKIKKIGPGDTNRVDGLATCVKTSGSHKVGEAGAEALARIGTERAKNALYSLIMEDGSEDRDVAIYASRQLKGVDPYLATTAVMTRLERGDKLWRFRDILIEAGDERALRYFIKAAAGGSKQNLADFVVRNREKGFLRRYSYALIPVFEREIVRGYSGGADGINCFISDRIVYEYAAAMHVLDSVYTKKRLLPLAESTSCATHPLIYSLRNDAFFPQDKK